MKSVLPNSYCLLLLWSLLVVCLPSAMLAKGQDSICPVVKIHAERLADLNIARSGHMAFVANAAPHSHGENGEVTVVGGHTSAFVPTPTAEYYKDGQWHLLNTAYTHDGGFTVALKSGKVMVAGGFRENLGIGQSFEVEMYDPETHRFYGFSSLNQKRVSATAVALDSGKVLITGNWYADDEMEFFDGHERFLPLKPVSQQRYLPYLFKTSDNDVLALSGYDNKGKLLDPIIVDRMKGEPFSPPLFDEWRPLHFDHALNSDDSFVGDQSKGIFTYLMPVSNKGGEMAIAEVRDTLFSLLPTDSRIPTAGQWGIIRYYTHLYADRQHQRGYVMGCDSTGRQYALCVDYAQRPARLTLYHTDPLTDSIAITIPVMMADGNLMLTGVKPAVRWNFNFTPTAQTWSLRFNDNGNVAAASSGHGWLWTLLALALIAVIVIGLLWHRRRKQPVRCDDGPDRPLPSAANDRQDSLRDTPSVNTARYEELMQRIQQLMDAERLYQRSDLKVSDLASALGVSARTVSDSIKSVNGCSFSYFVNKYRINYAQQLMRQQPDIKMTEVYIKSGFANETSFYRTFKTMTGLTPKEWAQTD